MIDLHARLNRAPKLGTVAGMIALWEWVLNFSPIGADDDFFELGGDSLQALTMFHEIERATGRALPLTAIYEAATPSRLVAFMDEPAPTLFSPLVPLKPGVGEPLFIVHGIGGNVMELRRLGRSIASPRPVYAIQAKGVDGTEEPLDNVADMVAYYLCHLRAVQPRGPYYLAGYSFGGIIAMEMARRMMTTGETVALLAFIDSFAHPQTFPKSVRLTVRLRSVLHAFRAMSFADACGVVMAKLRARGADTLATAPVPGDLAAPAGDAVARKVHDGALAALSPYWPTPYPGAVAFFRPQTSIFPVAPKRVWRKLVGALTLHPVPGTHTDMVREHAGGLALALSLELHKAGEVAKYG